MKVSIVGASGYGGGELLRLLLQHPQIEIHQCTSERFAGKPITRLHPNLRKQTTLKFCSLQDLDKVDLLFTALPHSHCMQKIEEFSGLADRMIDLSADFRLKDFAAYSKWYGLDHAQPNRLAEFVYGNVELHREEMKQARYISGAGCNATATILPLWPLFKQGIVDTAKPVIAEAKCGSSEGGNRAGDASHHPERSGCVRSYKPTGHRHIAEMEQELGQPKQVLTSVKGYTSVYSDEKLLDVMMMAYAGLRNKRIIELCQQHGINAVGLTGLDGNMVRGKRNTGIRVYQGKKLKIVRDFSGKPQSVNTPLLHLLLDNGYVPVLTVPIIDEHNSAINTENDDVVRELQKALKADTVINLIEAAGFLENKDDAASLIKNIPAAELEAREQQVEGRMKRKMLAVKKLFEQGATRIIISDGRTDHPVTGALAGKGTVIA